MFGSGRGSNFQAILAAAQRGDLPGISFALVVSNNSDAGVLAIALGEVRDGLLVLASGPRVVAVPELCAVAEGLGPAGAGLTVRVQVGG